MYPLVALAACAAAGGEECPDAGADYAAARELLLAGKRAEAGPLLERVLQKDPTHPDARHWLAQVLTTTGSPLLQRAAELLEGVDLARLSDAPPVDTVMLLGQCMDKLARFDEAERHYRRALGLGAEPGAAGGDARRMGAAAYALARVLLAQGRASEAASTARAAARRWPAAWRNLDVYAVALAAAGDGGAERVYRAAQKRLHFLPPGEREVAEAALGASLGMLKSGAWPPKPPGSPPALGSAGGDGRCTVPRLRLDKDAFLRDYADRNRPVILQGLIDHWPALKSLRRGELLRRWGGVEVPVRRSSAVAGETEFGGWLPQRRITLREFAELPADEGGDDPLFVFDAGVLPGARGAEWDSILRHFDDARFSLPPGTSPEEVNQVSYGPRRAGATFHQHSNAYAALISGRRRWFLFPPYARFGPQGMPIAAWAEREWPAWGHQGVECVQMPGEVMYTPTNWWHGVLNIDESISVVQEVGVNRNLLAALLG